MIEIKLLVDDVTFAETLFSFYRKDYTTFSDSQLELVDNIDEKRLLIRKDRQTGLSSLINVLIVQKILFSELNNITLVLPNLDQALLRKHQLISLIDMLNNCFNLKLEYKITFNAICFSNGKCINIDSIKQTEIIKAVCKCDWCIFDEPAFNSTDFYNLYQILEKENPLSKLTIIGIQSGIDKIIFPIYMLKDKTYFKVLDSKSSECNFFNFNLEEIKKQIHAIDYEREFNGKFICNEKEEISAESMVEFLNSYITKGRDLTIFELLNILKKIEYVTDYK